MGKYFGTDGFRGKVNFNLTAKQAYRIGEALGTIYKAQVNKPKFVIGRDTRLSGTMLLDALSSGINSCGGDVYVLDLTTTPSISYLVIENKFNAGIMISASHNPYYDNGIKLISSNGEKMDEDTILTIEEYMDDKLKPVLASSDEIGKTISYDAGIKLYENHLIKLGPNLKGLKIGLDLANGSAVRSAKNIFEALGANITIINTNPDGLNINTNCGSTHIEGLQKIVKENKLDIGFAYDGDADRCLGVDNLGNVLTGDHILYMCSNYLKSINELNKNVVVTTVMSNFGLYKAFDDLNTSYVKTKVGDKYVYEEMKKNDYSLGGEQSGHIIFYKHSKTGDGILTALMVLECLINSKLKASELIKDLTIYPQVLINVKVTDKAKALADNELIKASKEIEKELNGTGRLLIRESGTEPLIRIMVEAKTIEICNALALKAAKTLDKYKI